ncbi:hypothetical protein [Candidatus Berkiella aquae]|nr:hypothetical protein [Candidatus Berkiella aquae]MCS5711485.1 hypothetical protein [Candidatus Berkiella aquae]
MFLQIRVYELHQQQARRRLFEPQSSNGEHLHAERSYLLSKELKNTPSPKLPNNTQVDAIDKKNRGQLCR